MSAICSKEVAHLTKEVLQKMRIDASFKSCYDAVVLKSKNYSSMRGPVLPRRNAPRKIEIGTGGPAYLVHKPLQAAGISADNVRG